MTTRRIQALSATLTKAGFKAPVTSDIRGEIYRSIRDLLSQPENAAAIETGFPKKSITRRNTASNAGGEQRPSDAGFLVGALDLREQRSAHQLEPRTA